MKTKNTRRPDAKHFVGGYSDIYDLIHGSREVKNGQIDSKASKRVMNVGNNNTYTNTNIYLLFMNHYDP